MTAPDLTREAAFAVDLASEVGELLLATREGVLPGDELRRVGDLAAQRTIERRFAHEFPADPVLSEEAADNPARLMSGRVWIVDPLDGSREFAEHRSDWAVHVAFWQEGDLALGAVALPARSTVFSSDSVRPHTERQPGAIRLAVSRSRPPTMVDALAELLGAELVPMGSAGVKVASVIEGGTDAYVHGGGQYEWDSAAPIAVARAAGLHASRIDGSPLRYNQPDPWSPDLLVSRPEFADLILDGIRELRHRGTHQ